MKVKIIIALLAISITGMSVISAQNTTSKKAVVQKCFIDKNNNALCDKKESTACKIGNGTGYSDCKTNKNPKK